MQAASGWPWQPGRLLLERYVLETCLAEGAARQVWRAHDRVTQRAQVLKCINFQQLSDWGQLQQLEREALLLQGLSHPRLPRCEELLELPGSVFCLVQQALPGESLQQRLRARGSLSESELLPLAVQALRLLDSLHRLQPPVVHCDIKPSNLLCDDQQRLSLIDFGAAIRGRAEEAAGGLSGTAGYMPPEQLAGRPLPASDLYALGITLVVLLSGLEPNDFPEPQGRLNLHGLLKGLSPPLLNWLEVLVHPDPALRFQDAAEALEALPGAQAVPAHLHPPALILRQAHASSGREARVLLPAGLDAQGCWAGRYRPLEALGQQGGASTWRGEDTQTGEPVILKRLELQHVQRVKELELIEREQQVLQELVHPRLPRVRELIREKTAWLLVLGYLPGQTLLERLENGWRASEADIWELGRQALDILQALHRDGLLHRDLQPANLLWDDSQTLFLLDFGGVSQSFRAQGSGGSTLLGGMGYAPPEQWLGRAEPASDLYALGLTLVHLISGRSPSQLSWEGSQLSWTQLPVSLSLPLRRWLAQLTHPEISQRLPSVERALQALQQQSELARDLDKQQRQQNPQQQRQQLEALQAREAAYHGLERAEQGGLAQLEALGLPLPPPRLKIGSEALPLRLLVPCDRPDNQPRLRRRLQCWSVPLSTLLLMTVLLGLLGQSLSAFALGGLLLMLYPLGWQRSGGSRLGNTELIWEPGGLTLVQHWPQRWGRQLGLWRPLWRRQQDFLALHETEGLSLQTEAELPLEGGACYRLLALGPAGPQPWGAPLFLKDSERDWLLTALPRLQQAYRPEGPAV